MLTSQIFFDSLLELVNELPELLLVRRVTYNKNRQNLADSYRGCSSLGLGYRILTDHEQRRLKWSADSAVDGD